MHAGQYWALWEVLRFYGRMKPSDDLAPELRHGGLSEDERDNIVAFLRSLSGPLIVPDLGVGKNAADIISTEASLHLNHGCCASFFASRIPPLSIRNKPFPVESACCLFECLLAYSEETVNKLRRTLIVHGNNPPWPSVCP